jgi:hypothetical protein
MTVAKSAKPNTFKLDEVSFNELVILRKACEAYAKQGSAHAMEIVKTLGAAMDDMTV